MIVTCDVHTCTFCHQDPVSEIWFCSKGIMRITKNGSCSQIWQDDGQQKEWAFMTVADEYKDFTFTEDAFKQDLQQHYSIKNAKSKGVDGNDDNSTQLPSNPQNPALDCQ